RRTRELEDRIVHSRGLYDAAIERDVTRQHRQPAVLAEGMFGRTDHAVLSIEVERLPSPRLAERGLRRHPARRGGIELMDLVVARARNVPVVERIGERRAVHGRQGGIEQAGTVELDRKSVV